ncbi:hsp70 family protein [Lignipirellula cremea]|uniref:Chaperone protein HscA n=1 Tax=Lignipirellula cremea TaxID=2528010 RepID=A0A518DQV8_9BACT|nr:hsp70 family protein [Lignipirellula cremea]QDU94226.1 Chaperone protein HscA [Lignipirellula cremea]
MSSTPVDFDPLVDEAPSRYVVGIDLGTTNSALTYVDTEKSPWTVEVFAAPQVVAAGEVEARETLPSFHYQATLNEAEQGALRLPWLKENPTYAVGVFARDQGTAAPGRMIASAKSWLSHTGVDRTARLLPWHGAAEIERLSPVEVSSRYLAHLRAAWDQRFPAHPLADQEIVLTLPASFDEVARELTIEAAAQAGLRRVVLIEEPQAAFYAWVWRHKTDWEQHVEPGQKILVCDIGGGTSDFTLIRVRKSSEVSAAGHKVQFHRVAVGEHLILGGDNLDLALAKYLEAKLTQQGKLEPRQWDVLVRSCRSAKEMILADDGPEETTVNLPGAGSRLIGGGLTAHLTREEGRQVLLDGFFPLTRLDDRPQTRASGFQEFGLPYASDAAVTRYLAVFLQAHRHSGLDDQESTGDTDPARPDIVLFNGGVLESSAVRRRLLESLNRWFAPADDPDWAPQVLENPRLDLAVAQGAAYYGMVRRGEGVRIAASLARSYYIGVESDPPCAVCLLPGNAEPGQTIDLPEPTFELMVSQPVEFPLYTSSTRLTDAPGQVAPIDFDQMKPLPPIRTVLQTRSKKERGPLEVALHAGLTEIGALDLWCTEKDGDRRWRLQFDVRSATQTDRAAHESAAEAEGVVDEASWEQCMELLDRTFSPGGTDAPEGLVKRLEKALERNRKDWPTSLLRRIWEALIERDAGRRRSATHEARWLNLLGYCLRPGYGLAVDDWRVAETWRNVQGKLAHGAAICRTESLILWRRISGGLSTGQQQAVAEPLLAPVRNLSRRLAGGPARGDLAFSPHESHEVWRLLGSLELLATPMKIELGDMIIAMFGKKKLQPARAAMVWALGRLGQRTPLYGPLNTVTPSEKAGVWLERLMDAPGEDPIDLFAAMQMARRTDDRYRDLAEPLRAEVLEYLQRRQAPAHFVDLVRSGGSLDLEEQGKVFGESLPKGLRISS